MRADLASSKTNLATAVELDHVAKRFGEVEAVASLSLTIEQGERIAILGPSGSGKTTLLLLMCGQLEATSGRVLMNGTDLAQMRAGRDLACLVGMIHQQFDLVPHLSAMHNVLAGRLGTWGLTKALVSLLWPLERSSALAALARVGVADRAYLRAGWLSGGEQQRVAIARLLMQDPAVILADEPIASLDPARAAEVIRLLVSVASEADKTLVASIHSVELAREYFSRLIGLRNGVVQFDLPSAGVTEDMLHALYSLEGLRDET